MAEIIRMPRLSDTMEEGNIIEWLKKEGETVAPGDILAEVETDKATMELESFFSGTLIHIGVAEGPVPVDGIIAIIGDKSDDVQKILAEAGDNGAPQASSETAEKEASTAPAAETKPEAAPAPQTKSAPAAPASDTRIKASPLAKKMAEEAGIDLSTIKGSGDNGRIIKKDVEEAKNRPSTSSGMAGSMSIAPQSDFSYGSHPVSQMRKTIAKRLSQSKFTAPHFYLTMEINMDAAINARKEMNEYSETRISFNDLVVKACALALQSHPAVNASWTGEAIVYHQEINIGVAVAIDDGLMVPVVNNANVKSLAMLNQEVKALAGLAKERKLGLDQMQGNTFTISNLGMFDIDEFTAIINPPDSCIMAVGSIAQKPIVKDGEIVVGNIMKVTLSCDHRIVDGATGAKFLQTVKALLESPYRMLV